MKVRVQHRVQRHTLFVASAQRFLYRHRKRLSENEFTMLMNEFIEVCSSHSNRTMLGQVCFADSATRWRNEEFVHPDNTPLLSHQRNMLDHLLENEEIATLMALGLSFDYAPVVFDPLYDVNEFSYCCVRGLTEFVLYSPDSPFQVLLGTTTNNLSNSIRFYVLAESAEQVDLVRLYGTSSIESLSQTPIVPLARDMLLFVDLCSLNTRVEHRYLSWVQILHVTHIQCSNSFRLANREHYSQPVPECVIRNSGAGTNEVGSSVTGSGAETSGTSEEQRLVALRSRSGRLFNAMLRSISPLSRAANVAVSATLNPLTNITARHLARLSPYRRTVSVQTPPGASVPDEQPSTSFDSWHDPVRGLRRDVREEPREPHARPIRSRRFSVTPTRLDDVAQVVTVSVSANRAAATSQEFVQPPVPAPTEPAPLEPAPTESAFEPPVVRGQLALPAPNEPAPSRANEPESEPSTPATVGSPYTPSEPTTPYTPPSPPTPYTPSEPTTPYTPPPATPLSAAPPVSPRTAAETPLSLRSSSSPDLSLQPAYTRGTFLTSLPDAASGLFPSFTPTSSSAPCTDTEDFDVDLTSDEVIPPSPLLESHWSQINPFQNVFNGPTVNFPGRITCERCPNCATPFCHITDRQSFSSCVVPRGFLKTIIADSNGSGKTFTVISLCLQGDSRNNWVMVRSSQLPSWRYHCQQYSGCKFFVIASLNDVNVFFSMRGDFQDPALQYNIIIVVSSMVTYTGNKAPQPYRLFVDDNDISLMNVLSGQFNYVLSSDVTPATNSFVKSNYTNLIQTHDSCVETLFDLPPIVFSCQCISRPVNNWSFSGVIDFCIDLNPGNDVNNSALFRHVLFSHEYESINKLIKTIRLGQRDIQALQKRLPNPESDTNIQSMLAIVNMKEREMSEIQGNIQYQMDRVLTGNCIICLSRDHDYVVTHCCRNNICCDCLIKIDMGLVGKRRCPYCRQEHDARNSLTPVLLEKVVEPGVPRMSKHFAITPVQEAVSFISKLVSSYREHNSTCISSDNRNWCIAHPLKIVMCANTNMSVVNDLLSDVIRRFRTHHLKQLSIFQSIPEPALLLISNTNKVIFYDLPFVTHVVLVGEVNPILAQSLLTRVNRYGRKNPLQIQQFITAENISIREYLVSRGKDCPRVLRDIVSESSTCSYIVLDNYE